MLYSTPNDVGGENDTRFGGAAIVGQHIPGRSKSPATILDAGGRMARWSNASANSEGLISV